MELNQQMKERKKDLIYYDIVQGIQFRIGSNSYKIPTGCHTDASQYLFNFGSPGFTQASTDLVQISHVASFTFVQ